MQYLDNAPSVATPPPLLDPLTPREQEILHLMAKGLSSPKIAQQLIVGVSTVRSHIKHIYSKLDAHSRHEAISKARGLGLV
jgi:LuxR family maltose regulon positive regulatory protein